MHNHAIYVNMNKCPNVKTTRKPSCQFVKVATIAPEFFARPSSVCIIAIPQIQSSLGNQQMSVAQFWKQRIPMYPIVKR